MSLVAIPYLLIAFRVFAGLAAVLLAVLMGQAAGFGCALLLAVGVLSDIFDGVIARRIGAATDRLRKFDSRADLVFWIGLTVALLRLHPNLSKDMLPLVGVLGALELGVHGASVIRFGKEASPHHILSKLFGLGLWALFTQLFVTGRGGEVQMGVFALGVASELEALAITLILPEWRCDVSTVWKAVEFRKLSRHPSGLETRVR